MCRSTLAILLLTGIALAACAKKSSLYLDSGRSESSAPARKSDTHPTAPASPSVATEAGSAK